MKKILFLTSELPPQPGGIGNHAHQLAAYLSGNYKVTVVADQRSEEGDEEEIFDREQRFSVLRVQRRKTIVFTYLKRFSVTLKLFKSHDLLLVSGKFPLWVGGVLSLVSDKPILAIIHGSEVQLSNSVKRNLTNWSLKRLDHVISVSRFTLKLVENLGLKSTTVIPNGFDLPKSKIENSDKHKMTSEALQLITIGNLTQRKGQHNVIKALPQLLESFPDLIYHCAGVPTNQTHLENLAKDLNVEKHIKFHGRISEEQKFKLLEDSDIFLMLSEQTPTGDVEGFGIAILEANAIGLAAVGSVNCGIEDAIKDHYSGILVNPHHAHQVVSAIEEINDKQSLYSRQAKEWSTHFTWDKIGRQYEEVLEKFI